jgi:hypothetical protein
VTLTKRAFRTADAMNEVAWCYLEGYGTKKDKVSNRHTPFLPRPRFCTFGTNPCRDAPTKISLIPVPDI